jgi:hypothetical protein
MTENMATLFNSIGLLFLTALGGWTVFRERKRRRHRLKITMWFVAVAFIGSSIFIQSSAQHHEWEYKNDLVLRYQDRYEDQMVDSRIAAANAVSIYLIKGNWDADTNQYDIDSLENVLAFYDELGFYWKNHEVSTDVLYEHFSYDMRMFCQAGMNYIQTKRSSPTDWEYVKPLFDELTRIEAKRAGKSIRDCEWNAALYQENLNSEKRLRK